jgi:hypothetical protein
VCVGDVCSCRDGVMLVTLHAASPQLLWDLTKAKPIYILSTASKAVERGADGPGYGHVSPCCAVTSVMDNTVPLLSGCLPLICIVHSSSMSCHGQCR